MKLHPNTLTSIMESLESEAASRIEDKLKTECDCMTCEFCRIAESCPHLQQVIGGMTRILLIRMAEAGQGLPQIVAAQTKIMDFLGYGFEIGVAYSESQRLQGIHQEKI